jgi:molybdenum cofactor cytidylyltransferase
MHPQKKCSALILSAGNSSRMNFPKAFLKWDENCFFLEKIINDYSEFSCSEIIVVVNKEVIDYYNSYSLNFLNKTRIVINDFPELPRLISVQLGLQKVTSDFCFIQNIDNPFTDQNILSQLYAIRKQEGYVAPVIHKKSGHPILLGRNIYNEILTICDNSIILSDILKKYERFSVPVTNENILCNINTPEEYDKYFKHK